ncbi:uncharacterized protein LOC102807183 [Saccoglossus kowalevskii]|uniref:Uncharacterized protein LOC102807183 n=1 Tax=Saccoglossus kowalevskii TaxID=10224 RepID=A0ABM0MEY2_SACKO|nr:PREDICTED: uncharacterized protein LOC102807183 [Saccoglossus kowalevskii]
MAFFGFLRVSEFTAPTTTSYDSRRTLLNSDILAGTDLTIRIKTSKTDPYRRGCDIVIAPSGSSVCAVQAYKEYQQLQQRFDHHPAFIFRNGLFLTRQALNDITRQLITRAGVQNAHLYSTHSFRSGAATSAAKANLPDWLIKTLGRWRSDSYQIYITTPVAVLRSVPSRLVSA